MGRIIANVRGAVPEEYGADDTGLAHVTSDA